MNFINKYSWKCFLSVQTKNINQNDGFYYWTSPRGKRIQLVKDRYLTVNDLPFLATLIPFNFFYFYDQDIKILQQLNKDLSKDKGQEIIIPTDLNLTGKTYSDIRNAINKNKKKDFSILDKLNRYEDVLEMLARWGETSGEKYFQDRSGKNKWFFKNNFHAECHNTFIYDKDKLIAFAVINPEINGYGSYIIGKALCLDYPGLSEYADYMAYLNAAKQGVKFVNLGGGSVSLRKYKLKFPGAIANPTCNGSVDEI